MVGQDASITGGLAAAFTLLIANWLVNRLGLKWIWLERRIVGTPTLLIHHGSFIDSHLLREGISRDEVLMALREHGVANAEDADLVVLEVDGAMSVVPINDGSTRTKRRLRGRKPVG